jgi:hypothetical protein
MAGTLVPLVLLPRYTTLSGATTFTTIGMDASEYEKAILSFWRSSGANLSSITINYEESIDQSNWTTCSGGAFADPGANTEGQHQPTITKRWFRISVTLTGAGATTSVWCIGFLQMRES